MSTSLTPVAGAGEETNFWSSGWGPKSLAYDGIALWVLDKLVFAAGTLAGGGVTTGLLLIVFCLIPNLLGFAAAAFSAAIRFCSSFLIL